MTISSSLDCNSPFTPHPKVKPLVFVVDDDLGVRLSLETFIMTQGWDFEHFSSAQEFLSRSRQPPVPCCLILEVGLPGITGLDLQQRLLADGAEIPIIFVTGCRDVPTTVRAMKAGAVEFFMKPFVHEELSNAIKQALARSNHILAEEARLRELQKRHSSLTGREQQVLSLVILGLLNKQVAHELGISEITVKAHRGKMMHKMKARTFVDLVIMAGDLRLQLPSKH